jgi:hypothetical protein
MPSRDADDQWWRLDDARVDQIHADSVFGTSACNRSRTAHWRQQAWRVRAACTSPSSSAAHTQMPGRRYHRSGDEPRDELAGFVVGSGGTHPFSCAHTRVCPLGLCCPLYRLSRVLHGRPGCGQGASRAGVSEGHVVRDVISYTAKTASVNLVCLFLLPRVCQPHLSPPVLAG